MRSIRLLTAMACLAGLFFSTAGYAPGRARPEHPNTPEGLEVEQRAQGERPPVAILESFDGLGAGFQGPQGGARLINPSDNSLAVGRDHIVQIVNSRIAIFTKRGRRFPRTGVVLY